MALADGNRRGLSGEQLTINNIVEPSTILSPGDEKILGLGYLAHELAKTISPKAGLRLFKSNEAAAKFEYGTKRHWELTGRAVRAAEIPTARILLESTTLQELLGDFGISQGKPTDQVVRRVFEAHRNEIVSQYCVVTKQVPLWHADQTKAIKQQPRTRAYLEFERIFFDPCDKRRYLWFDVERNSWKQQVVGDHDRSYRLLSPQHIRRHINGKAIHGVCAGSRTRFLALDLDFHGHDRDVFLEQAKVLLGEIVGREGWHFQVARDNIDGIHAFKVFTKPIRTADGIAFLKNHFCNLDKKYPDLAKAASKAGMTPFAQIEIYPDYEHGFRLPLCWGRAMLLDRPLELVTHKKKLVQNVEGYVQWLQDPDRKYMSVDQIMDTLEYDLAPKRIGKQIATRPKLQAAKLSIDVIKIVGPDETRRQTTQTIDKSQLNRPVDSPTDPAKVLGSMKGRFRQVLIEHFSGQVTVNKSLNELILLGAIALWLEGIPENDSVRILHDYFVRIPDKSFSSRLNEGDWRGIDRIIVRTTKQFYKNHNYPDSDKLKKSSDKLKRTASAWKMSGFKFSDKLTWDLCWVGLDAIPDIDWSAEEQAAINNCLSPLLKIDQETALQLVNQIIKLVAAKEKAEDGIAYPYWRSFIEDKFDIAMGNRNKVRKLLDAIGEKGLNLINVHAKSQFFTDGRKGHATRYSVAAHIRDRLGSVDWTGAVHATNVQTGVVI